MARKGFDRNSCDLILNCIASPSTSVLVNGKETHTFQTSRGIRKGEPISPYIFIICMEYLANLIYESADLGKWKTFCLKRKRTPISHLMFVDDLLLFGDTSPPNPLSHESGVEPVLGMLKPKDEQQQK